MNYKDVVTESNSGRVYDCKLINGAEIRLQVHENCETEHTDMVLYEFDSFSDKYYRENEVADILKEVEFEDEDSDHWDSFDDMDFKSIEKYLIQKDVYQYKSRDELTDILAALNEPIIDGGDKRQYYLRILVLCSIGVSMMISPVTEMVLHTELRLLKVLKCYE